MPSHGTGAKIFRLPFELGDGVQPWCLLQQVLEGLHIRRRQMGAEDGGHTVLFIGERCADHVLQHAVSRSYEAVLLQVMQELTEDIDRFPRYHTTCRALVASGCRAWALQLR
jgi:hypothetical protein